MSLKGTAKKTLELIAAGTYQHGERRVDFSDAQHKAICGTQLYTPDDFKPLSAMQSPLRFRVEDATTQEAAHRMAQEANEVALLNFASARNVGGGFLNGAKAQEEDLCRCSGLYPALATQNRYYEANRACPSLLYTDHAIFTPQVPFFRIRSRGELLAEPFLCSVITAPAPNGAHLRKHPDELEHLLETFRRRWRMVAFIAADQGIRRLLLGAWGCGAFGNEADYAAATARESLSEVSGWFDEVVFAVPGKGKKSAHNLAAFRRVMESTG